MPLLQRHGISSGQSFRELFWDEWLVFPPSDGLFSDSFTECHRGLRGEERVELSPCTYGGWGRGTGVSMPPLLLRRETANCLQFPETPQWCPVPLWWPTVWMALGSAWKMEKGRAGPGGAQTEPRMTELGGTPEGFPCPIAQVRGLKPGPAQQVRGRASPGSLHPLSSGLTWPEPLADPTPDGSVKLLGCVAAPAMGYLNKGASELPPAGSPVSEELE